MVRAETAHEQYKHLLFALNEGWGVDPPVYIRPSWSTRHAACITFHFVLRRRGELTLISVQDNPVVRDLLNRQEWPTSWLGGEVGTLTEPLMAV